MDNLQLSSLDESGVLQHRYALIKAQAALDEGRMVLFVRAGQIVDPQHFFTTRGGNLQKQIEIALRGGNVDESQLAEAYGASSTAYSMTNYRADQLASIPLIVTNPIGVKQEWNPAAYFISTAPIVLWHVEASLIIFGKTYLRKLYNEAGYPTGLQWIHNDLIRHDERMYSGEGGWIIRDGFETYELYEYEAFCIENYDPTGKSRARSEYEVALAGITTERGAGHFTAAFFINEARPDGILISKRRIDPESEEWKQMKAQWKQFQGAGNAHRTFFATGGDWEWIPITPPLIDLALTDVRNSAVLSIGEVLRTNPVLVGAASVTDQLSAQNTFSQIERHHIEAVTIPRMERLILPALNENWLWTDFSRPRYYTLAIDRKSIELLSNTTTESVTTGLNATLGGFADYDEGRDIAGLEPREAGDWFSRDPQKAIDAFNSAFMLLDETRTLVGFQPLALGAGQVVKLPTGQFIPLNRLLEVANANADALIAAAEMPPQGQLLPQFLSKIDTLVEVIRTQLLAAQHPAQIIFNPAPTNTGQVVPALSSGRTAPIRAVDKIEISLDLANNAFIRYAVRTLSRSLSNADILSTAWIDGERWRLPIVVLRDVPPSTAAALLRELELDDVSRLDLTLAQVVANDGTIQAVFEPSGALNKLQQDLGLQISGAGIENALLPPPVVTLAYVTQAVDDGLLELETSYPLSIAQILMTVDNQTAHVWTLRAASPAQMRELDNWQFRAARHKRTALYPVTQFEPIALKDNRVVNFINWGLALGVEQDGLFKRAKAMLRADQAPPLINHDLSTPDEYDTYWQRYDKLADEVGAAWLDGYMEKAFESVKTLIRSGITPQEGDIGAALRAHHNDLVEQWIGTNDEPGALIKLVYAGMAAGNESVLNNLPADYRSAYNDLSVEIQWDVISQGARDFVQQYSFDLIQKLDNTTRERVRSALDTYLKEQKTLDELEEDLATTFTDRTRARRIAQTESIRAYNNGVDLRWKQVGVNAARWMTVRDSHVCPICEQLNGQLAPLDDGWSHPGGQATNEATGQVVDAQQFQGRVYKHPAHTGCRCFKKPQVPDKATIDFSQFGGKPNAPDGGDKPFDPKDPAPSPERAARLRRQQLEVRKALDDAKDELEAVRKSMTTSRAKYDELQTQKVKLTAQLNEHLDGDEAIALRKINDQIAALRAQRSSYYGKADEESRRKWQELSDQITTLSEAHRLGYDELMVKRNAARIEIEKNAKKVKTAERALTASVRTPVPLNMQINAGKGFKSGAKATRLKEARAFLEQYFNGEVYGKTEINPQTTKRGRAFYNRYGKSINLDNSDDIGVYVHEIVHGIEMDNPDILRRCIEFRDYRTRGESEEKLSVLTNNPAFADREIAKADKFFSPYVGKIYRDSQGKEDNTEVLSMGVEYFFNDPIGFQTSDPEYFDFIVAILKGLI